MTARSAAGQSAAEGPAAGQPAVRSVGVIGAGEMGNGIAHVFALAGFDVTMTDTGEDRIRAGLATIAHNLDRQIARGTITAGDKAAALARITTATGLRAVAGADLVIEVATEDEALKHAIFRELTPALGPDTLLATNTSSISITRLASGTDRPERFMGLHFMNPVPMMQLVELVRGIATSDATYDTLCGVIRRLGKTPAPAADFPGFIVNRILMPMINEAIYTLFEGVGSVTAIDEAMQLGANHPMGPLALADFIGLDTCIAIMTALHEGLADTKYRPCPLLVKYVEAGWLGRKTGRGFYDYRSGTPVPTR